MAKKYWKSKTLVVAALVLVTAVIDYFGIPIPKELYVLEGALGLTFLRTGKDELTK